VWKAIRHKRRQHPKFRQGGVSANSPATGKTYTLYCQYTRRGRVAWDCGGLPDGSSGSDVYMQIRRG